MLMHSTEPLFHNINLHTEAVLQVASLENISSLLNKKLHALIKHKTRW